MDQGKLRAWMDAMVHKHGFGHGGSGPSAAETVEELSARVVEGVREEDARTPGRIDAARGVPGALVKGVGSLLRGPADWLARGTAAVSRCEDQLIDLVAQSERRLGLDDVLEQSPLENDVAGLMRLQKEEGKALRSALYGTGLMLFPSNTLALYAEAAEGAADVADFLGDAADSLVRGPAFDAVAEAGEGLSRAGRDVAEAAADASIRLAGTLEQRGRRTANAARESAEEARGD